MSYEKPVGKWKKVAQKPAIEALEKTGGNVSAAAKLLGVHPCRFRAQVSKSVKLNAVTIALRKERREQMQDIAEDNVMDALIADDDKRKDSMSKFVLSGRRGFNDSESVDKVNIDISESQGPVTVIWNQPDE